MSGKQIEKTLLKAAKDSGLSMRQLSLRSGAHYASIHAYMRDGKGLAFKTAAALAATLGLELAPKKKGGR